MPAGRVAALSTLFCTFLNKVLMILLPPDRLEGASSCAAKVLFTTKLAPPLAPLLQTDAGTA